MRNYIIYTIIFISCCLDTIQAQQDAISNHYWVTPSVNNPALIGLFDDNTINISGSMLDYWTAMPYAPKTINIALEMPIQAKNIAIGAFFQQEEYFLFKESRGSASFNYRAKFSDDMHLRVGFGIGFLENRINFSGVSVKDMDDDLILNGIQTERALQLGLSLGFRYKQFCVGTSVPYFIINKNSNVGLLNYGNHDSNTPAFRKPFVISHYLKQSLLNRDSIDPTKHLLDISLLVNVNVIVPTKMYTPNDVRLNLLYRFGNFAGKKKESVVANILKLDALKFGGGFRVAWKNSTTTFGKTSYVCNLMSGFEIGRFLEINYIIGINTVLSTIGTSHEVICKIKINPKKTDRMPVIMNNDSTETKILGLGAQLKLFSIQIDSLSKLCDTLQKDIRTMSLEIQTKFDSLKSEIDSLDKISKMNETNIGTLQTEIIRLKEDLEIWKQILGGRQDIDIEIKTPPNSKVNK